MTDEIGRGDIDPQPVELTAEEEAAFAALPREADPGELLEERTVRTLRAEGLLTSGAGGNAGAAPARDAPRNRPWWRSAAAIAAGVALFAGGLSIGQMLGARVERFSLVPVESPFTGIGLR